MTRVRKPVSLQRHGSVAFPIFFLEISRHSVYLARDANILSFLLIIAPVQDSATELCYTRREEILESEAEMWLLYDTRAT